MRCTFLSLFEELHFFRIWNPTVQQQKIWYVWYVNVRSGLITQSRFCIFQNDLKLLIDHPKSGECFLDSRGFYTIGRMWKNSGIFNEKYKIFFHIKSKGGFESLKLVMYHVPEIIFSGICNRWKMAFKI